MENNLIQLAEETISLFETTIKQTPFAKNYVDWLRTKKEELNQPCILAVSGQVSAGKSTFVNALIGKQFAKTGIEEVTATLTYFKHGVFDEKEPVSCYWESGLITKEPIEVLFDSQGYKQEVLERNENISHFEVSIETVPPKIIIVDTPGMGAVVQEHEDKIKALISKRNRQTETLTKEATAVIYLIGTPNANIQHQDFLKKFKEATGGVSKPMNAVGVMSMIDKSENVLFKSEEFAQDISNHLKDELNTVVPISAAIYASLEELKVNNRVDYIYDVINKIPDNIFDELFEDKEFFDEDFNTEWPINTAERKDLRKGIPWTVFKLIAKTFKNEPLKKSLEKLYALSGFDNLKEVLEQHFFQRAQLLTCYKVINDLRKVLDDIEIRDLLYLKNDIAENKKTKEQFIEFVNEAKGIQSPEIGQSLIQFIEKNIYVEDFDSLKTKIHLIKSKVETTLHKLQVFNDDFFALNILNKCRLSINDDEYNELKRLFGMYGSDWQVRVLNYHSLSIDLVGKLQNKWKFRAQDCIDEETKHLFHMAQERYGNLLFMLNPQS